MTTPRRSQDDRHRPPRPRALGSRVICVAHGQLLLVRHVDPPTGEEYWLPPGGGRERGETLAACAVREVFEETGLAVRVIRRLRVPADAPSVTYGLFLATPVTHQEAAPIVDLSVERYLRGAAWHPITPDQPLGPLQAHFWGYLRPLLKRLASGWE
jgi:8-oxo-dGTP pyrophosphatase MutT (NUDIX family)